jgi:DNA primase
VKEPPEGEGIVLGRSDAKPGRVTVAGVSISHPERVMYADSSAKAPSARSITKLDVARFYERIAEWIVPHVEGRPLTLVRCPEGLAGDCFYMKHSKVWAPTALRRVKIQEKTKVGDYLVADDIAAVVSLVQMDILEIHTWNACADKVELPNRIVFDFDPGVHVPWVRVIESARLLRQMLKRPAAKGCTSSSRSCRVPAGATAWSSRARSPRRSSVTIRNCLRRRSRRRDASGRS